MTSGTRKSAESTTTIATAPRTVGRVPNRRDRDAGLGVAAGADDAATRGGGAAETSGDDGDTRDMDLLRRGRDRGRFERPGQTGPSRERRPSTTARPHPHGWGP